MGAFQEELASLFVCEEGDKDSGVCQWFNKLKEKAKNYTSSCADSSQKLTFETVLPHLVRLLRQCMLTQRWSQALKVMNGVCRAPVGTSYTIWKAGIELLMTEPEANTDLIQQLYNQMKQATDLSRKEVVMEYASFLLGQGNTESAVRALQENMMRGGVKRERTSHDAYVDVMFRAFTGLVWYIQWLECRRKIDDIGTQSAQADDSIFDLTLSQPMSQSMSTISLEMQLHNYTKKAILGFEALVGVPGVWDVFVTKHVELLEYDDQLDEALAILQTYSDINADNVNTHVYLYTFYCRHQPGSEHIVSQLKAIANKVPSHPLVLEMCTILKQEDNVRSAVSYLFPLLDYPCWQADAEPWQMLANCLETVSSTGEAVAGIVAQCWGVRRAWWPAYHFSTHQAVRDTAATPGLLFSKAVVATILCGEDNAYTTTAVKHVTAVELSKLQSITQLYKSSVT